MKDRIRESDNPTTISLTLTVSLTAIFINVFDVNEDGGGLSLGIQVVDQGC